MWNDHGFRNMGWSKSCFQGEFICFLSCGNNYSQVNRYKAVQIIQFLRKSRF